MIFPQFVIYVLMYNYLDFRKDPSITSQEIANYISVALAVALSVHVLLVRLWLLSDHLSRKSCPFGWPCVLIVFCLFVILVNFRFVLEQGLVFDCNSSCSFLTSYPYFHIFSCNNVKSLFKSSL